MTRAPQYDIEPGDRAPNFVLPVSDGKFRMFYERTCGRPVILLFTPGERFPAAMQALQSFAAQQEAFAAAGVDVFCVSLDEAAAVARQNWPFLVWSDPKKAITDAYRRAAGAAAGAAAPADEILALLLDANQRVLAVERGGGEEFAGRALDFYLSQAPTETAAVRPSTAPVLVLPNLLDPQTCRDLIDMWHHAGHSEGTVGSVVAGSEEDRVYYKMKKRLDHRIADPQIHANLNRTLGRRLAPEVEKAFTFEGFRFDAFLVVCYEAERGDCFRPHRDNISPGTADRRFAMTLNLNTEEYEGGELVFPEYGPHRYKPGSGGAVVFSCSLIHEALPVTRGRRFALLTFLRDAKKQERKEGAAVGRI